MIIIGVVYGALTGNIQAVADGAVESAKDAVALCITMLGVMSLWTGLMQVADKSGLIAACTRGLAPFMRWMFPNVPKDDDAMKHMTTNVISNILGLGWAATPAGLRAMSSLSRLNEGKDTASNEMCTFLVLNVSSLQLIPMNMIAYRSQYGSANPTAILVPAIIATSVSTLTGIIFAKIMSRRRCKSQISA